MAWASSSPYLNPLDYQVWRQCWSTPITSCNQCQEQFPSSQMHFSWFGLPYRRKPVTMLWKTAASDCSLHACVILTFWTYNVVIHIITDTNRHLVQYHLMWFGLLKNRGFCNKLNWILKIWGVLPLLEKVILFTQIFT